MYSTSMSIKASRPKVRFHTSMLKTVFTIERRLAKLQLLHNYKKTDTYFKPGLLQRHLGISDDHLPFIHRGQILQTGTVLSYVIHNCC